jgi:hypothetical protein
MCFAQLPDLRDCAKGRNGIAIGITRDNRQSREASSIDGRRIEHGVDRRRTIRRFGAKRFDQIVDFRHSWATAARSERDESDERHKRETKNGRLFTHDLSLDEALRRRYADVRSVESGFGSERICSDSIYKEGNARAKKGHIAYVSQIQRDAAERGYRP